jgi:uncharacterized membrane protein YphA (DoxX/SURF4 family)
MVLFRIAQTGIFAVQFLLALFFLFVGGMKLAAPMAVLQLHHAWVANLPELAARLVGASELLCAAIMILGVLMRRAGIWSGIAACALLANQAVAVMFHIMRGEIATSGPQNLLIAVALACVGAWWCAGAEKPARAALTN